MNERIQELAEQAGLYVDLDGTPWPRAMSAEESEAAYEKFAELIVQECAGLLEKDAESNYDEGTDVYDKLILESKWIKQHFGVEP
jgi:hypothetical protein